MPFFRTERVLYDLLPKTFLKPVISPIPGHHILVIDRSGSMYGDMAACLQSVEQALAVEGYLGDPLTTLISFSSQGDVTLHWSRLPLSEVLELKNPYIGKLRGIRATALTGISQGLNLALDQVREGETTGVSLFTDGYANDPSPAQENRNLDRFVERAQAMPGLFFNAIGYRTWCDWPRMQAMTTALSGTTTQAKSFKDVLEVLKNTQELVAKGVAPALEISHPGGLVLAINRKKGQVNAAWNTLQLRGVSPEDDLHVFGVDLHSGDNTSLRGALPKEDLWMVAGLAAGLLGMAAVREAKEVLFASGNKTLWEEHQTALTPSSLADLLTDLRAWMVQGNNEGYEMGRNTRPQWSLKDLGDAISKLPASSVGLDPSFLDGYRRRSLKRVPGKRLPDGTLEVPRVEGVPAEKTYIRGFGYNRNDATVQLETVSPLKLRVVATGEVVEEIAHVPLRDLEEFRSYTLISSGERNVEQLPLLIYTKQAWEALSPFLIPSLQKKPFEPGKRVVFNLKRFALSNTEGTVPSCKEMVHAAIQILIGKSRLKLLTQIQDKVAASPYTAGQAEQLKEHYLSPALYFSPPTTYSFVDRGEAIAKGEIDSYTRIRVSIGTTKVLSATDLRSGNEFLARRYVVKDADGKVVAKPKLADTYSTHACTFEKKGGVSLTPADEFMDREFVLYLGGAERLTQSQIKEHLEAAEKLVEGAESLLHPLVMELGCTGYLPQELASDLQRYTAEEFAAKYPEAKLPKEGADGTYWVSDAHDLVISACPETEWYTV